MKGKKHWRKILIAVILACALVAALLEGNSLIERLQLTKLGIVLGVSVDRDEQDYVVCAQLVEASSVNTPQSGPAYQVIVGKGKTLMGAFDHIKAQSSLYPAYAHCKVLFVGEELTKNGLDGVMKSLLTGNLLSGDVQVVATQGEAKKTITSKVPILTTSSAYMAEDNVLVSQIGGRKLVTIKDYCAKLDGKSGTKYLPYAIAVRAEPPTGQTQGQTANVFLYDLDNTVAFDQDGNPHVYGKEVTRAVGLLEAKGGQVTAYDDKGGYVTVAISKARRVRAYAPAHVIGNYFYSVRVIEQTLSDSNPDAEYVQRLIADAIDKQMRQTEEECRKDNVDIFSLQGRLYKRYGQIWPLEEITWERNISVQCL